MPSKNDGFMAGCKKAFKDKKNKDLWLRYLEISKLHNIKFNWVRGHAGHPENERCDELAVAACKQKDLLIDSVFEAEVGEGKFVVS